MKLEQKPKNSAAKIKANNKWKNNNYDTITLNVPPGQKERITLFAKIRNISRTKYIVEACEYYHQTHPINPGAVNPVETPKEITDSKNDGPGEDHD